ncbi:MAG: hypothetical protein HRU23_09750 [Gammaproteobacteria bacterium]|nr:hypothetical protein [Gammaproteobacteria bacterium]
MKQAIQKDKSLFGAEDVYARLGGAMELLLKSAPQMLSDENKFHGIDTSGPKKKKAA